MQTLYITHPACHLHEMGDWHPESPERLDAINDQLLSSGVMGLIEPQEGRLATREDILRAHTADLYDFLVRHAPEQGYAQIDPDTYMNPHTLEAALAAAGAGLTAVDSLMAGHASTAFCAVRPPGHHACRNRAMGFSFFNNLAVTVAYTLEKYDLKRVAIFDFDVHHGNGTAEIFAGDPRVLMCGFYQGGIFPDVHTEKKAENMLNIPVEAYSTGDVIREVVTSRLMPELYSFEPEFVFISAGFDAHREDELAQLGLVEDDYAWLTSQVVALADQTAHGRVVSFLEGGYALSALGRSVVAHVRELAKL